MFEKLEYYKMHDWLRDIAKPLGIKVGGKTVFELMEEIQCAVWSLKLHSPATAPETNNISTNAFATVSSEVKHQ